MIVRAKHEEGFRFEMESPANTLISDQWEDYGGEGAGPMPGELFLFAVASCFGQAMVYVANKMRKTLPNLHLVVDGNKSQDQFRYGAIIVTAISDADPALMEKVMPLAKKYCFVTNSLSPDVALSFRIGESK